MIVCAPYAHIIYQRQSRVKRTNVHLTDLQRQRLEKLAKQTTMNQAEHIRRAIDFYLDEQERKQEAGAVRLEDK